MFYCALVRLCNEAPVVQRARGRKGGGGGGGVINIRKQHTVLISHNQGKNKSSFANYFPIKQ